MHGRALINSIKYFMGKREAYSGVTESELAVLREYATGAKIIVELGVDEGKTSRALREVMHPRGTIWLIDPFPGGLLGISWSYQIAKAEVKKSKNGTVRIMRQMSMDAAATWKTSFDFLFIDADHSYDAVTKDWKAWSPFAKCGAHIALHDSCCMASRCRPSDGPVRFVEEISSPRDSVFKLVRQEHSLSVFRRL
jgi:hypothetical protein